MNICAIIFVAVWIVAGIFSIHLAADEVTCRIAEYRADSVCSRQDDQELTECIEKNMEDSIRNEVSESIWWPRIIVLGIFEVAFWPILVPVMLYMARRAPEIYDAGIRHLGD